VPAPLHLAAGAGAPRRPIPGCDERRHGQAGQASVELVALLPLVVLAALAAWQLAIAGHTAWAGASAARAAARAHAVGADARTAATDRLPRRLRTAVRVTTTRAGEVRVRVPVPLVLGDGALTTITTRAHFAPQR